ncbi:Glucose 1-dehydrogenase [Chitinispirillum alkaliphilum]|nr:Glucose 1-dehydrogenase [Chitinispirillum alkaliphilum]
MYRAQQLRDFNQGCFICTLSLKWNYMEYYSKHNLPTPKEPHCPVYHCLPNQKAIVTGASSGIGKEVAIMLAKAGADVCVNYSKSEHKASEVAEEINLRTDCNAFTFKADVSKEDEVLSMFNAAQKRFGHIDIVVCNAGIQRDAPLVDMSVAQFDEVIGINLRGQFLCSREAVRIFKKQGIIENTSCSAGKILSIASVHDIIPWAGHVNYAASKGGVAMLIKSIAQEVAQYRIRANIISPGAIRTPINIQTWQNHEAYEELMKLIPYKRIGEPREVGRCAVWLASDQSDYINGATVYIDGGMTLYPGFETGG